MTQFKCQHSCSKYLLNDRYVFIVLWTTDRKFSGLQWKLLSNQDINTGPVQEQEPMKLNSFLQLMCMHGNTIISMLTLSVLGAPHEGL